MTAALIAMAAAAAAAQSDVPGRRIRAPGMPSSQMPRVLSEVRFDQRLNEQLPLDAASRTKTAATVTLGDYFGSKPVVLAFVYYECPMLCTQVLNGLTTSLTVLDETVGREFDVVAISFDARETPVLASGKKKSHLDRYKRPESASGWHFLTGDEASIAAVTDGGRLQVRLGRTHAAVRAPERHRRRDAGGQGSRATSSASSTRRGT